MFTIAANVQALIEFNRSMAVALEKAENGSTVEDGYFIEKLAKTAGRLGYRLEALPARMDEKRKQREQAEDETEH